MNGHRRNRFGCDKDTSQNSALCLIAELHLAGLAPAGRHNRGIRAVGGVLRLVLCLLVLLAGGCAIGEREKPRGTWHVYDERDGWIGAEVRAVAANEYGDVWLATTQGVSVLTVRGEWMHYRVADGLASDDTRDILVDRRGRVWVATKEGVSRFDGETWRSFTSVNSDLPQSNALRLIHDAQGRVWVLLALSGLAVIHPDDTVTYVGNPPGEERDFHSLTIDSQGHIWLATLDGLLIEYNPEEQRWPTMEALTDHISVSTEFSSPILWQMTADREPGHLWMAANNIVERKGRTWFLHFPEYSCSAALIDPAGYKWFAVVNRKELRSGLLVLSPNGEQWTYYSGGTSPADAIRFAFVYDIALDPRGNYWFATGTSLVRFTPEE